ncbi:MAG: dTDP-4-dehydrorhamnose 3,5-epimerase [Cyclobacteriaceae bacterium]|nr:dTDP-4-dehydrorhamnose 3,5-epimerase [Cyclobacteriaceae bacterium]
MEIVATEFKDLFVFNPKILEDERGYFFESYSRRTLLKAGIDLNFIQDNQSCSKRGVLRGLHYQIAPYPQTKLVRVLSGRILDVVVDLRKEEKTFGKYFSIELSSENNRQLLVPKGFAHGFITLSDQAVVFYKCDEYYYPNAEQGLHYSDPAIDIDWGMDKADFILSEKDKKNPTLANANLNFK